MSDLTLEQRQERAAAFRRARRRAFKGIVPEATAKRLYGPTRAQVSEDRIAMGRTHREGR